MAMTMSLPATFLERLKNILTQEHFEAYLQQLNVPKRVCFRVNTLKISAQELLAKLTAHDIHPEPVRWYSDAFSVDASARERLTHMPLFGDGFFYIQNLASIFASLVLAPKPGEEVLDLAAAPGGKTLHMACLMHNEGRIAAVEAVKDRFFRLKGNIKTSGATIIQPYLKDGSFVWRLVPERFDRVLLDAPCSSEGRFDLQDPKTFTYWSDRKISEMSRKQKKLIYSAIKCLKPGGLLLYSTCSLAPEEDEAIIDYVLEKFSDQLEVVPIEPPFDNYQKGLTAWQGDDFKPQLSKTIRIIPNELMVGFFLCLLRKKNR